MEHECVYILASGPSLLTLSEAEKNYLNAHPNTIAMNKYLMYWELVGVVPKMMFAADFGSHIAKIVAAETMKISHSFAKPIPYYLNQVLHDLLKPPRTPRQWWHGLRYCVRFWRNHGYWIPSRLNVSANRPIIVGDADDRGFAWAQTLRQPLYHHHGSLTTAINLAALLYPMADIMLLGVDMNGYHAFYEIEPFRPALPRFERHQRYHLVKETSHHQKSRQANVHVTAVTSEGKPGVQSVIPAIRERLQAKGRDLYCANPESLLVTEDYCPFRPVLDGR